MQCSLVQAFDIWHSHNWQKFILLSVSSLNAGPFNRSGQNTVFPINWRDMWNIPLVLCGCQQNTSYINFYLNMYLSNKTVVNYAELNVECKFVFLCLMYNITHFTLKRLEYTDVPLRPQEELYYSSDDFHWRYVWCHSRHRNRKHNLL